MTKADDRLIFLLFTAQQKIRNYLNQTIQAENIRITVPQAGILFLLKGKDGRTMSEIGQLMGLDNSTVTGLADRLEKAGFLKRNSNPNDRRSSHLMITPEGLAEALKVRDILHEANSRIKEGFSDEEIDCYKRVLRSFFGKFETGKKNQSLS
ncbi:MAG: MarR family transcriptional regulator [Syntrophaceae bacterium]